MSYYGTGPCEGTLFAGSGRFNYGSIDDGRPNSAYVSVDDCLLRSIIGANKNGPRTIVIDYKAGKVDPPSDNLVQPTIHLHPASASLQN